MPKPPFPAPAGKKWIFATHFKHYRSGKEVYREKGKPFCFLVKA